MGSCQRRQAAVANNARLGSFSGIRTGAYSIDTATNLGNIMRHYAVSIPANGQISPAIGLHSNSMFNIYFGCRLADSVGELGAAEKCSDFPESIQVFAQFGAHGCS
jgi:hypothetical protein